LTEPSNAAAGRKFILERLTGGRAVQVCDCTKAIERGCEIVNLEDLVTACKA